MEGQIATSTIFFKETKPAFIRIWHWLTFILFAASLTTVLLSETLFKTRDNIAMVQEQVVKEGGNITEKQARSVAHEYGDKLWMVHKYIGFGLSFLLLWRIIAEISISKEMKLSSRIKKAVSNPYKTPERKHYLIVQNSYIVFYVLFILMVLTGLILAFEDVEWLKSIHKPAKNFHGLIQYGLYAFMAIHIIGVIRADITQYGGIISRMINGKNQDSA